MSELLYTIAEIVGLLNRIVPRIDAGGPNPIDEQLHHCEYTLYRERERIHSEFRDALRLSPALAKHQSCGCVVCTCEDDEQCQGCGARHCGTHKVGAIPEPIFEDRKTGHEHTFTPSLIDGGATLVCSCGAWK